MNLRTLLRAPARMPSPLSEVYNAVAEAVYVACTWHLEWGASACPPVDFRSGARGVADSMAHAENAIQQAELWLRANAPGALEAFEDALAQVAFVEHACTHVLGRRFENRPGTSCNRFPRCPPFRGNIPAYFASWPTVGERAILGQLRQKLTEALSHAGRDAAPVRHADAPGAPEAKPADPEAHAIALLFKHPHLTIPEIAAQVGVTRQTLYDWPKFRQAAEKADKLKPRGPKGQGPRRGHKTKDRRIEAYTKDSDPSAE